MQPVCQARRAGCINNSGGRMRSPDAAAAVISSIVRLGCAENRLKTLRVCVSTPGGNKNGLPACGFIAGAVLTAINLA